MSKTKTRDYDFDLASHEKLDEIDLRTNDDGTVQVQVLEWEEIESLGTAHVSFRAPGGDVKKEEMKWPNKKDSSYKFIRFIEATPYTLRTAEDINEDDDLWLDADPDTWELVLPEEKALAEKIPKPSKPLHTELLRLVFFPLVAVGYFFALVQYDLNKNDPKAHRYEDSHISNEIHLNRTVAAFKAVFYMMVWIVFLMVFVF